MDTSASLTFPKIDSINPATIDLAASKSISNRALIISALCEGSSVLHNLAEARDTQLMIKLLKDPTDTIDVLDAGTTMRFLTGFFALTNQHKIITGTPRMQQRPIGVLVKALREIGAVIEYQKNDGYPPIKTKGFNSQLIDTLSIPGNISSQYISSLLMMAPILPNGLEIIITDKIMSRPYIEMTLGLMKKFGATYHWDGNAIKIPNQQYHATELTVESDWSAASYWYSLVALSEETKVTLTGLEDDSLQGDRQIVEIMKPLGVDTKFHQHGLTLTRVAQKSDFLSWDFSGCPDLGPTVMVTCAALGVRCEATGLESLYIKETDRIAALKTELAKVGAKLIEEPGTWKLLPGNSIESSAIPSFKTYDDHRMAMAFAPLSLRTPIQIEEPHVVRKSYPGFWRDLESVGIISESK